MASYAVLKIVKENESEYPDAAIILHCDRYMDDLIHLCPTPQLAASQMTVLDKALAQRSFKIKEWYCSSQLERNEKRDSNPLKPATPKDRVGKATPSQGSPTSDRYQLGWRIGRLRPWEFAGTLKQIP